jgi:hypothetical protein
MVEERDPLMVEDPEEEELEEEEKPKKVIRKMVIRDDMTPDEVMKLAEKKGMAEFLRTIGQSAARFQY